MKFGICGKTDRIKGAYENGFDYIEPNFGLFATDPDEEYYAFLDELKKYSFSCESANCFIPGELKVTGPDIDYDALTSYLEKGFKRASDAGLKTVVFGSGGARNIPDGYSYRDAVNDMIRFVRDYAAPIAAKYGIAIVFEPLNRRESNIINTVKEGAMLASAINLPNVGALADNYHMYLENDSVDNIRALKGLLLHAHISNPAPKDRDGRCYMSPDDEYDYANFIDALEEAGCERVSIEAGVKDFDKEVVEAAKVIKKLRSK